MQTVSKKNSLGLSLVRLLLISMAASVLCFWAANVVGDSLVQVYYLNNDYLEKRDAQYIQDLQEYVTENRVSAEDSEAISQWVYLQQLVFIQVYRDGFLLYDSGAGGAADWQEEEIGMDYLDWSGYYEVHFSDGLAQVVIDGTYVYQLYNYSLMASIGLSFLLFLILMITGIRKKMQYIQVLSREIELLESGNLDYPITVRGKDELAELARGLDEMRRSFREQVEQEARLVQENQKIITEMSHDLRTPLTAIMLYTEILKKGNYKSEEQLLEYIEKIERKARRMNQLTNHLFEYSLVTGDTEMRLEKPELYEVLFYDLFSETSSYLSEKGFRVKFHVEWTDKSIRVDTNYIARIMDNITSNIIKYADPDQPVVIHSLSDGKTVGFSMENALGKRIESTQESTGIGLQSVKTMMRKMGGRCRTEEKDGMFRIEIVFPCVSQE